MPAWEFLAPSFPRKMPGWILQSFNPKALCQWPKSRVTRTYTSRKTLLPGSLRVRPWKFTSISQEGKACLPTIIFQWQVFSGRLLNVTGVPKKYWLFLGLILYWKASNQSLKWGRIWVPMNGTVFRPASWISRTDGGNCSMILPGIGISWQPSCKQFAIQPKKRGNVSGFRLAENRPAESLVV